MKTLTEIKNEVAFEKFETRWDTSSKFYNDEGVSILEDSGAIDEVAKRYAQQACEDLRERIADSSPRFDNHYLFQFNEVEKEVIRNSKIILP